MFTLSNSRGVRTFPAIDEAVRAMRLGPPGGEVTDQRGFVLAMSIAHGRSAAAPCAGAAARNRARWRELGLVPFWESARRGPGGRVHFWERRSNGQG